ncbi:MAG: TetR/AcrR family transcriptional regulator [Armatimonadota bacterium]|nr:MAG: TetR/AcrR family transcriptional regulator [Armatimonadota bacterium]
MAKSPIQQDEQAGAKERIMEAAERLFADQGYSATSVGQIAEAARVNRALLYYYFKNKRDLYWAIIHCGLEEVLALLADANRAPGGAWQRVERFVRSYCELLVTRHNLVRIVFREMTGTGEQEQLGLPIQRYLHDSLASARALFQEGEAAGEFQGLDSRLTAFSLFGMIHIFFMERLTRRRRFSTDAVVAHTLELLRHGAHAPEDATAAHSTKRSIKRKA